jgi:hypothetical protein
LSFPRTGARCRTPVYVVDDDDDDDDEEEEEEEEVRRETLPIKHVLSTLVSL